MPLDRQLIDSNLPTSAASSSGGLTMNGIAVKKSNLFVILFT